MIKMDFNTSIFCNGNEINCSILREYNESNASAMRLKSYFKSISTK